MSAATPLVFRPSALQRTLALLLCAGSWLVGARALASLLEQMPILQSVIIQARAVGDDPWRAWLLMTLAIVAVLVAGILLLASILGLVLMEGTQVFVDELGIAVELAYLPRGFAHWLGAGRIPWKQVSTLTRSGPLFVILSEARDSNGGGPPLEPLSPIRFLVVDEIERLVNLILERSPNISFKD
ncbi:MAG: hypothetical protein IPP78_00650 [Holophagaceae bacterium]|nr:hypothetical protein [Holophagaceae bacterium]